MATGRVPTTANSPLTAKGDLFGYSTTQARVAVGNNGETLVADSSASTGLSYQANWAAGKNKIINGDFTINQRGFTTSTAAGIFIADRMVVDNDGSGTVTKTLSGFTPGTAPVTGYESTNYATIQTTGQTATSVYTYLFQSVEDVRTFANQTVTYSFWAKAATGTPKISIENRQNFGSGGSAAVNTNLGFVTLSTSWTRYSVTGTVPSVSGKTIGAGSYSRFTAWVSAGTDYSARTNSIGIQTNTFDIWGVQVEAGSVATAFQTATGTIQGELAACRRYLPAFTGANFLPYIGYSYATNNTLYVLPFDVPARVAPTGLVATGTCNAFSLNSGTAVTPTFDSAGIYSAGILAAQTITAGQGSRIQITSGALLLFTGCEL
jgi:hypothetical protein